MRQRPWFPARAGKLMDERMGHEDGSVQARYSHITAMMRRQLLNGLTTLCEAALAERRRLAPGSPSRCSIVC